MAERACNLSTQEAEAIISGVQGHLWPHFELKISLDSIRPCLKKSNKIGKKKHYVGLSEAFFPSVVSKTRKFFHSHPEGKLRLCIPTLRAVGTVMSSIFSNCSHLKTHLQPKTFLWKPRILFSFSDPTLCAHLTDTVELVGSWEMGWATII